MLEVCERHSTKRKGAKRVGETATLAQGHEFAPRTNSHVEASLKKDKQASRGNNVENMVELSSGG